MSSYHYTQIKNAKEDLVEKLQIVMQYPEDRPSAFRNGEVLMESIDRYINAKIDEAKDDLQDQINKTGIYDPDY